MKDLLFRSVKILDPGGTHHEEETDIRIQKGIITRITKRQSADKATEIKHPGLHISPGWVDLQAHFRDPGEEYKEDLNSGLRAAAAGGYTAVALMPSTKPVIDSRSDIEYLIKRAGDQPVRVLPVGALSKGLQGEELAELYDMHCSGAVAFTSDQEPLKNARLLMLALQYVRPFNGLVITFPNDADLSKNGHVHEGMMSIRLGMRGIPAMAETVQLERDLALLDYTAGRMHVANISTAGSVQLIRDAKARGLKVTASVAAHHLLLDDGCLRSFDTNYKVMPPLRDATHIAALREGVKDGTIDAVVSDHRPEDVEHKRTEFEEAAFGIIGLETAYAVTNTAMKGHMTTRRMLDRFCLGPRKVLGLDVPKIEEGVEAEITLFDPEVNWTFEATDIRSRSKNSPFVGHPFAGRPVGIVARGQAVLNESLMVELT